MVARYATAYRGYCWEVESIEQLRLAPFHLLASEAGTHIDKHHRWHMDTLARLSSSADKVFVATPYKTVNLNDRGECDDVTSWWKSLRRPAAKEW